MNKYHKIYDDHPWIEDEIFNLIYIPMMNKSKKVSGYTISNLYLKDKLLQFSYHQTSQLTKGEKRYVISGPGISMHEIVIGEKADEGYVIDHIDSDGLLNTEENLRYATDRLNAQNRLKKSNTTSKYIGVSFCKDNDKWKASMMQNFKNFHIGTFENEIEAAKAYDVYTIFEYKGQSPKTNDLLSRSEIEDIRRNGIPEKYQKKTRSLPKNISLTENNTYSVEIAVNKKRFRKIVKTLEEAIIIKAQILENIEESKEIAKGTKEITRNKDGLAIIYTSGMECIVDEDHWHDLNQYTWICCKNENDEIYGYPSTKINKLGIKLLHLYVYEKYVGDIPSDLTIDHKSRSRLDVRLKNLRLADRSLQMHNRDLSKDRIEEYKGIQPITSGYTVTINGKYRGIYKIAEEAAQKANEVYTSIYGQDATLNDIDYSKKTTIYDRIPMEDITKEYIMSLTKVIDVQSIVKIKNLNTTRQRTGEIKLADIKLSTIDKYKQIIVNILYPPTD